ncbi:hypothetical protein CLI82_09195 [Porphyromonas gingivalis]|nr:hypothetical protein CLI82_09195 [Porphyromonas gingivalis]
MARENFSFGARMKKISRHNEKKVARILQKSGSAFSPFHARDFHPLLRLHTPLSCRMNIFQIPPPAKKQSGHRVGCICHSMSRLR